MNDAAVKIRKEARESYTGKTLTNGQFGEAWALSGVMNRTIRKTGSFVEKLADYSHAFARSERFDALKAETIIRDMHKARYGQTMNELREEYLDREERLREDAKDFALEHAQEIEPLIRDGQTMPFYRAYDQAACHMATKLSITEAGAKDFMKSAYREAHGVELYEAGKAWEKQYHDPVRQAARQVRSQSRSDAAERPKAYSRRR